MMIAPATNKKRIDGWELLQLIVALREAGLSISSSDLEDALSCMEHFSELDVKTILQANFVHSAADRELFETIWRIIREKVPSSSPPPKAEQTVKADAAPGGQGIGRGQGGICLTPQTRVNPPENLFSQEKALFFIQTMGERIEGLEPEDQVQWVLGQMNVHQRLNDLEIAYRRSEITEDEWQAWADRKIHLEKWIRQELIRKRLNEENRWAPLKHEHWLHRSIRSFTLGEKNRAQQAIKALSRKLAHRSGLRRKHSLRGTVSIRRTMEKFIQGNGTVFQLVYEKRLPQKAELVVLCDISNSVLPYSEFLLFLVENIKLRFRKIRLFLFIDSLWDITPEHGFAADWKEAIHAWSRKNSSGYSDYGQVFSELYHHGLDRVSSQATLLILGDGRNNYRPAQAEYLKAIQEKVKRVYWLNPLDEKDWYTPDNALKEYAPYCTRIFRCRTVKDLHHLARRIF